MTDSIFENKTIEYSQVEKDLAPLNAQVEIVRARGIRIPISFYDDRSSNVLNLSEEEMSSLEESFAGTPICTDVNETYVNCTVLKSSYTLVFQTKEYGFYATFPIPGYPVNPYYEIYEGEVSMGRIDLLNGVPEDIHSKIMCLRDIVMRKIGIRLSGN